MKRVVQFAGQLFTSHSNTPEVRQVIVKVVGKVEDVWCAALEWSGVGRGWVCESCRCFVPILWGFLCCDPVLPWCNALEWFFVDLCPFLFGVLFLSVDLSVDRVRLDRLVAFER